MQWVKSAVDAASQKIDSLQGTDLEKKVKEATSNENWGTSGSLKNEIADATNSYQDFREVMGVLWKRIAEKESNWRIVFKSLDLLMFLLKFGHDRVCEETRDHQVAIRPLLNFHYFDPDTGTDRGRGIREISKQILDLVNDRSRLRQAREDAQKQRGKLQSIGRSGQSSGGGGNYSGYSGGGSGGGGGSSYSGYGGGGLDSGGYNSNWKSTQYKSRSSEDAFDDFGRSKSKSPSDEERPKKKKKKKRRSSKQEDDFASGDWDDEEPKKKKKKKKKKKRRHESDEDTEEASDSEKEEKPKKKKKAPKGMKLEPLPAAPGDHTKVTTVIAPPQSTQQHQPQPQQDSFNFDDFTGAVPQSNPQTGFDDFSAFSGGPTQPQPTQQSNNFGFDDGFGFEQPTSAPTTQPVQTQSQPFNTGFSNTQPQQQSQNFGFDDDFQPFDSGANNVNNSATQQPPMQQSTQPDFFSTSATDGGGGGGMDDFFGSSNQATAPVQSGGIDIFGATQSSSSQQQQQAQEEARKRAEEEERRKAEAAAAEEKRKAEEKKKKDAWSVGGDLINLSDLSATETKYAAFDPKSAKSGAAPSSSSGVMPSLTSYGAQRPDFASLQFGAQPPMQTQPPMGMGMGMQQPQMGGGGMGMGMGMNQRQMGMGMGVPQQPMGGQMPMGGSMGMNQMGMGMQMGGGMNMGMPMGGQQMGANQQRPMGGGGFF